MGGSAAAVRTEARLDDLTLARARRGDERAIAELIRQHERLVFSVVGRMLAGRSSLVEDVAQEVFLKILRHLPKFDPNGPATLATWIVTVATRTAIDALRRPVRGGADDALEEIEELRSTPLEVAAGRELEARLVRAMAALPADQRAVLVLRAFHDFDYPEIATALGIEEGTVKSRLSRARIALRRVMEGSEGKSDA
jgi:RNA polymerase sigma-70 factor, ECF subfamily